MMANLRYTFLLLRSPYAPREDDLKSVCEFTQSDPDNTCLPVETCVAVLTRKHAVMKRLGACRAASRRRFRRAQPEHAGTASIPRRAKILRNAATSEEIVRAIFPMPIRGGGSQSSAGAPALPATNGRLPGGSARWCARQAFSIWKPAR